MILTALKGRDLFCSRTKSELAFLLLLLPLFARFSQLFVLLLEVLHGCFKVGGQLLCHNVKITQRAIQQSSQSYSSSFQTRCHHRPVVVVIPLTKGWFASFAKSNLRAVIIAIANHIANRLVGPRNNIGGRLKLSHLGRVCGQISSQILVQSVPVAIGWLQVRVNH